MTLAQARKRYPLVPVEIVKWALENIPDPRDSTAGSPGSSSRSASNSSTPRSSLARSTEFGVRPFPPQGRRLDGSAFRTRDELGTNAAGRLTGEAACVRFWRRRPDSNRG